MHNKTKTVTPINGLFYQLHFPWTLMNFDPKSRSSDSVTNKGMQNTRSSDISLILGLRNVVGIQLNIIILDKSRIIYIIKYFKQFITADRLIEFVNPYSDDYISFLPYIWDVGNYIYYSCSCQYFTSVDCFHVEEYSTLGTAITSPSYYWDDSNK